MKDYLEFISLKKIRKIKMINIETIFIKLLEKKEKNLYPISILINSKII